MAEDQVYSALNVKQRKTTMSGKKKGTIITPSAVHVIAAGATVAAAGALLGAGALAMGLVANGMVRLGREIYNQVDDQIRAKIVKEEIEQQKRFREILKKTRFEVKEAPKAEKEISDLEMDVVYEEHEETEAFMKTIEALTRDRTKQEINQKMKSIVSDQMDKVCKEIKAKSAGKKELAGQERAQEVKEPDFGPFYKEIRGKSKSIGDAGVYLDLVAEIEDDLKTMEKDRENFGRLISRLNRLTKNLQENPILYDLADIYNEWARNKSIKLLKETGDRNGEKLLRSFDKAYKARRREAETGTLGSDGVDEFRKTMEEYLGKAESYEARIIFNEDLENIKKAMRSRGFVDLTWREEDGYVKITGKREEDADKASCIWIKSLDNTVADAPQLHMEVEGYETYPERKKQNEAIISELGSLGLTIAWEETAHDMSGNLIKEPAEAMLKEKLPHLNCKVLSGNRVHVEGKGTFLWKTSVSVDQFKQNIIERRRAPQERKRVKEE